MEFNIEQRQDIAHILLNLCDNVLSTCNNTSGNIGNIDKMKEILNNISNTINEIEKHI